MKNKLNKLKYFPEEIVENQNTYYDEENKIHRDRKTGKPIGNPNMIDYVLEPNKNGYWLWVPNNDNFEEGEWKFVLNTLDNRGNISSTIPNIKFSNRK